MIVHEWHVEGDPACAFGDFPPYHFVFRSDDKRWCGAEAEQKARAFVERCLSETDPAKRWNSGPRLSHRTVTYSEFTPVPIETETPEP